MTAEDHGIADRLVTLEGGFNFRDFGGYAAADGRRVKRGLLYRSGVMTHLTGDDAARLHDLGIATICDLRTTSERAAQPTLWHEGSEIEYWARDYQGRAGNLGAMLSREDASAADLRAVMIEAYQLIPWQQADSYRAMFERLAAGRVPLVVNCSAGKDRTGIAVALVLAALGVPKDVIEADYLFTNRADFDWLRARFAGRLSSLPPEVIAPMFASDLAYLDAMFVAIENRHGSISAYLRDILGIGPDGLEALRANLLDG